jgi:hypothetical protein
VPARRALGAAAGAAVGLGGGLLLGEYAFGGLSVVGAAVLIGLLASEAALAAGGGAAHGLAAASSALATVAGLLLAAWTSTGARLDLVPALGWLAFPLGAAAAALRAWPRRPAPRAAPGTPPDPGPEP